MNIKDNKCNYYYMSSFQDPLILIDNGDETFTLYKGFTYHVGDLQSGIKIVVPEGFTTDFASSPRILWNLIPPYGKYGKAAVLHDFLYEAVRRKRFTRVVADALFLEAMSVLGVGRVKRLLMYWGVRVFGVFSVKKSSTSMNRNFYIETADKSNGSIITKKDT